MKNLSERINWPLVVFVGVLLIVGIINLYSALSTWEDGGHMRLFWSQIVWIGVGSLVALALAIFDYRLLERMAYPIYGATVLLLVLVLFFGKETAGHRSWLGFAGFGIQPSEFAKVTVIFALAKYFSDYPQPDGFGLIDLIKPGLIASVPMVLVLLQGDFGSALFFVLFFISYAWFAKMKRNVIVIALLVGILGSFFSYYFIFSDYQKARFTTFLNPSYDVKGSGYHLMQSKIAVGSGMIWGKGYLKGSVNKLRYLPEKHTDFIFPVFAEEWGFAGCMALLACYFILFTIIINIARTARDRMGIFLTVGVGIHLLWQTVINLGGVLGIMPLTGITLPFLSYGGSSIVSLMATVGILLSVSRRRFMF